MKNSRIFKIISMMLSVMMVLTLFPTSALGVAEVTYTLTIDYQYEDGTEAAPQYQDTTLVEGATYSVASPDIPGYSPDQATVSGTMLAGNVDVTVTYYPTSQTLTIYYQYDGGAEAATTYTHDYLTGEAYSVDSPDIPGYRPDQTTVSDTMAADNVEVTVVYHQIYTLTINYQYEDTTEAASQYTSGYIAGEAYSVISPDVTGYKPDQTVVSGTMSEGNVEAVVIYHPTYTLTINYQYADGSAAASQYTGEFVAGETYSVASPSITHYFPDQATVSGTMPGETVTVTVTYVSYQVHINVYYKSRSTVTLVQQFDKYVDYATLTAHYTGSNLPLVISLQGQTNYTLGWKTTDYAASDLVQNGTTGLVPTISSTSYSYVVDVVLKAPPNNTSYTVTYNSNGGTGTMIDPNSPYADDASFTVLANSFTAPTGQHFAGWNTQSDGFGTPYLVGSTYSIIGNITLYALWEDDSYGYTVNYYQDSVAAGNLLGSDSGTGAYGSTIPYTDGNYLPAGYTTPGAVSGQTTITEIAADNVLNVVYDKDSFDYTVNYYQDSTAGTLLGTDTGSGLFGSTIPYTDGKYLPTGYTTPGATSGQTTITEIAANNVLSVVYSKDSFDYTVNYYQDSIAAGNLLGSDTGSGLFGSTIPYTDGKYLSTGYTIPGATSGQTIITEIAANNVLSVVYSKDSFGYTVNYYQDSVAAGNLLGSDTGSGLFGSTIPYTDGKYLPTGYTTPGATSGQTTVTAVASNNVLNVLYGKDSFDYTVNYYQDSIAAGNLLGSDFDSGLFGSTIPYTDGKYLPTGYTTPGAVSGQTTISATVANVLNIVYSKDTFDYTVNYYQDSIAAGNLLGSDPGSGLFGSTIPYTDGKYLPTGYVTPGATSGQTTITEIAANNVFNVVYNKGTFDYTVNYYQDSIAAGNLLGSDPGSGTFGSTIPYTDGKYLPTGYVTPGATSGQTTITEIAANNVFNVVYNKGTFDYTVNYYQDSIAAGNLLGSDPGSGTFGSTIPYTDGKYLPTGYVTPGATSGQTTITEIAANNVFNVVYNKGTFDYTVNYYQDSIAAGNLLGSDPGSGLFGSTIPYTDGKYLPTGYVTPGATSGQTTITEIAANNVFNVVYNKGTFDYTVNYYQDSIAAGNLLGSDPGSGTFGSTIPYTDGKYLPTGYVTPGATSGQTTITEIAANNVFNVVYNKGTFDYTVNYYQDSIAAGQPARQRSGFRIIRQHHPVYRR